MLKADTKVAMLNYQKLHDSTEANLYLENFARKLIENVFKLGDGGVLENDIDEMSNKFRQVTSKFEAINGMIGDAFKANSENRNLSAKIENLTSVMARIEGELKASSEFFEEDLPIVNDNISMVIERFDSLCDE